ncbi:ArsA family ATPase [Wenjunlia vitaminophila]|uniref:ArsA family ATPase n=1 Tax=Wenjunlia vitaminophila TaxID=76728 RepID=UPI002AFFFED9|nr:ArsA-related P-loop ATPase [Wenjunlia vitaminophila]
MVTGDGGAGRTTAAAATAVRSARRGTRTLLLTGDHGPDDHGFRLHGTDPGAADAHGLGSLLGHTVPAGRPVEVEPGLAVHRFGPRPGADDPAALTHFAAELLGTRPLDPEEFTALPGAAETALLRALREHVADPRWDLVVVDCPPLPVTLTALALPERLHRHLDRLLPAERRAARALHPLLAAVAGAPVPPERLYEVAGRVRAAVAAARTVVEDNATTVHLVLPPQRAAQALRRARPALALFGHRLEALLVNQVLPTGSGDPWLAALSARQRDGIEALRTAGLPVRELPHLGREPAGRDDLAALGAGLAVAPRPPGPAAEPWTVLPSGADAHGADAHGADVHGAEEGQFTWRLPLPGAERSDLHLVRRDDELVVDLGPYRRILPLPAVLRRCTAAGASVRDGALLVRFTPDPGLWPRRRTVG